MGHEGHGSNRADTGTGTDALVPDYGERVQPRVRWL